jgi:hypothetical protein
MKTGLRTLAAAAIYTLSLAQPSADELVSKTPLLKCGLAVETAKNMTYFTMDTVANGVVVELNQTNNSYGTLSIDKRLLHEIADTHFSVSSSEGYVELKARMHLPGDDAIVRGFQSSAPKQLGLQQTTHAPNFVGYEALYRLRQETPMGSSRVNDTLRVRLVFDRHFRSRIGSAFSPIPAALVVSSVEDGANTHNESFYRFPPSWRPFRTLGCINVDDRAAGLLGTPS